jgi:predicted TPR repeat methyltransferase
MWNRLNKVNAHDMNFSILNCRYTWEWFHVSTKKRYTHADRYYLSQYKSGGFRDEVTIIKEIAKFIIR